MSASASNSSSPPERRDNKEAACSKAAASTGWENDMLKWVTGFSTALIWTAVAAVTPAAADKVVLMLNWYVYGEHAPFYYGKAKGIYAAPTIDLAIQYLRDFAATGQAVTAKTADFGYV